MIQRSNQPFNNFKIGTLNSLHYLKFVWIIRTSMHIVIVFLKWYIVKLIYCYHDLEHLCISFFLCVFVVVGGWGLTFLTPPLSFRTTTSSGESLRPCQQRRKFLPILPNPLIATLSFASVLRPTLLFDLVACGQKLKSEKKQSVRC
jgi:hypothetical protein